MPRSLTDAFKVIAAIAVVGIHATSLSESRFAQNHSFFTFDFLSTLVNQWARFSVPLFVYLSAYGLAKSQKEDAAGFLKGYIAFLTKRLPTILVPYFFFSAIALAMEFHSYSGNLEAFFSLVVTKLLTGGADYHLYFLVILTQCYLLFPALLRLSSTYPGFYRFASLLSLVLVSGFLYKGTSELLLGKLGLAHPGWHASFVIYWLPYFMLGILHAGQPATQDSGAADNVIHQPLLWKSIAQGLPVLFALGLVITEYVHYSYQGTPVDYYNHFSRPSVMLYALAVIWWLNAVSPSASGTSPASGGGWEGDILTRLAKLAPLTFSVYLIHPQLLRIANSYLPAVPTFFIWILVSIFTFSLVYALTLITTQIAQKSPAVITGPMRFFQRCLGLR